MLNNDKTVEHNSTPTVSGRGRSDNGNVHHGGRGSHGSGRRPANQNIRLIIFIYRNQEWNLKFIIIRELNIIAPGNR